MNLLTACCKAELINGHTSEYPLNDNYSISYKSSICNQCLDESPEMVQVCDNCGLPNQLVKTSQGDFCRTCTSDFKKELIVRFCRSIYKVNFR
jgi:predicted amidophosphoribosyltransferase